MDFTTLIGIALGVGAILAGQRLEGGHPVAMVQLAAALIVFGGTLGAVVTQFPRAELRAALGQLLRAFRDERESLLPLIDFLTELSRRARREGLVRLEETAARWPDPFLQRAIGALVDGYNAAEMRGFLDQICDQEQASQQAGPRVFEAAGGYAPTIGIVGAVLGLIHVMSSLAEPDKLGAGIAVAFVATVYGVGSANLVFLPLAGKLALKIEAEQRRKELITEAVCAIHSGLNPLMMRRRLSAFLPAELLEAEERPGRRALAPRGADA